MRHFYVQVAGVIAIVAIAAMAAEKPRWVQPTQDNVGIYANEIRKPYEQPILTVNKDARMEVLATGKDAYKVKVQDQIGWVEKRLTVVTARGSKSYTFDDAEVIGYLDNPTPVYIIDADDQESEHIKLDRSFAEALRENVDEETIARQVRK